MSYIPTGTLQPSSPALSPSTFVEERPAMHGVHCVAAVALFVRLPAAQGRHAFSWALGAYFPRPQSPQTWSSVSAY